LGDGVFALAIALMLLGSAVPTLSAGQSISTLPGLLTREWIGLMNCLLSFSIAAIW
jgi:uncharacterized membrane protein